MVNGDRCVFRRQLSVAAVGSDDGEEGSESFVSSSSSGELDCFPCEKSHKSPSQNQSPLLSSSMQEGEHQGVEYKGCVSEEEKEQLSPVSIMDFPCQYEDDEGEDEEARTFGFERNLANIEKVMAAKFKIEKFDGSNFSLWKLKIKAILRKDNCLAVIGARPDNITDDKKWNEMDENAIANLHLAFADMVLSSMEEKKTANET
ncbi:uncharacterized protein LOC109825817 isoform X3 [Asparagus officinalis]|uniref:uncharacterized protein LOC109825817 isoform X3 n=1 Tax=Asparagus officinalis TaxID=4686 RepID=UPI00098E0C50|nr:uncharacterized protein LOC109825817 isoform X3 [Asparagus officinalis]